MALASGFTSNAFSMAAGHIPLVIPDPITVGALSAIVDGFAFGAPIAKLQASNSGLADPFAFGTQIAKLQAHNTGLSDPFAFGTSISKLQVNSSGFAVTDQVGNALVVHLDWSAVTVPSSTDFAAVSVPSSSDFTEVSDEGSL